MKDKDFLENEKDKMPNEEIEKIISSLNKLSHQSF